MATKKTELRDTIGLKFDRKMTGRQLQDCGIYKDSDGYLIPTTGYYGVMFTLPWTIVSIALPKDKAKKLNMATKQKHGLSSGMVELILRLREVGEVDSRSVKGRSTPFYMRRRGLIEGYSVLRLTDLGKTIDIQ